MMKIINKKSLLTTAAAASIALLIFFPSGKNEDKTVFKDVQRNEDHVFISAFEDLKLDARAAYIYDLTREKTIFEMNADAQLPLASLTKLMTAAVAGKGSQNLSDLIDTMLISSSNDATAAIVSLYEGGDEVFVSEMNKKALQLGLDKTYFLNPTGLDSGGEIAGAYGSARDVVKLIDYLLKNNPSLLEATRYESLIINGRKFSNTNELIDEIPGVFASKTGLTDLAGGNLAMVIDLGLEHPIIIVVLGSTEEGRFRDVKELYGKALKYFNG